MGFPSAATSDRQRAFCQMAWEDNEHRSMSLNASMYLENFAKNLIDLNQAYKSVKYRSQDIDSAISLLKNQILMTESDRGLFFLVDALFAKGENLFAKMVANYANQKGHSLHVSHYINSDIPKTLALVDDEKKILYIPIPKCGSSTIKNYFTFCIQGKTYGEFVHFNHNWMNRVITADDLSGRYAGYFKFSVTRDPIDRVVSYFQKNVVSRALFREALGEKEVYGLETVPGPRYCADRFLEYRQIFLDFRHHTDPMVGYIGFLSDRLDRVFMMSEIAEIRGIIAEKYDVSLEDVRAMESGGSSPFDKVLVQESFATLKNFYRTDYALLERLGHI